MSSDSKLPQYFNMQVKLTIFEHASEAHYIQREVLTIHMLETIKSIVTLLLLGISSSTTSRVKENISRLLCMSKKFFSTPHFLDMVTEAIKKFSSLISRGFLPSLTLLPTSYLLYCSSYPFSPNASLAHPLPPPLAHVRAHTHTHPVAGFQAQRQRHRVDTKQGLTCQDGKLEILSDEEVMEAPHSRCNCLDVAY